MNERLTPKEEQRVANALALGGADFEMPEKRTPTPRGEWTPAELPPASSMYPVTRTGNLPFPVERQAIRIRRADSLDVPAAVRMAVRFAEESPYHLSPILINLERLESMVWFLIDHGGAFVAQIDGTGDLVGMIGASIVPHAITGELVASESAWWVAPEHRSSTAGIRLLAAAELWAKDNGAASFQMIAPAGDERLIALYRRRGYRALETVHVLRLAA